MSDPERPRLPGARAGNVSGGGTQLRELALTDLDGDGLIDLVLFDEAAGATYLDGTGDGGLPYPATGTLPTRPVVFGDVDGDDLPDGVGVSADVLAIEVFANTSGAD